MSRVEIPSKYLLCFYRNLIDRRVILEDEVEIDIVLPFCSPSECICLHRAEREEIRDQYPSLEIDRCNDGKREMKKCHFHTVDDSCTIPILSNMEYIPLISGTVADILYCVFPEGCCEKKIEVNTFSMSNMECDRSTSHHVKTPLSCLFQKTKYVVLLRGEYRFIQGIFYNNDYTDRLFRHGNSYGEYESG